MGLAAINFNMDESKIGGFNKGFVDSRESSPATKRSSFSLVGDSENESDKDSPVSWPKAVCHHSSSISDTESSREKEKRVNLSSVARSSSSSGSILSDANSSPRKFVGEIQPADQQVNAAPRLSDSDSSSEVPSQRLKLPSSSTVVRTSPLYISVYTSTPAIPVVKGTVSSSTSNPSPVNDDDELFFTRRSPSPRSRSKLSRSDAKI